MQMYTYLYTVFMLFISYANIYIFVHSIHHILNMNVFFLDLLPSDIINTQLRKYSCFTK